MKRILKISNSIALGELFACHNGCRGVLAMAPGASGHH